MDESKLWESRLLYFQALELEYFSLEKKTEPFIFQALQTEYFSLGSSAMLKIPPCWTLKLWSLEYSTKQQKNNSSILLPGLWEKKSTDCGRKLQWPSCFFFSLGAYRETCQDKLDYAPTTIGNKTVNHISTSLPQKQRKIAHHIGAQHNTSVDKFRCPNHYKVPWEVWTHHHQSALSTRENCWTKHGKHLHQTVWRQYKRR